MRLTVNGRTSSSSGRISNFNRNLTCRACILIRNSCALAPTTSNCLACNIDSILSVTLAGISTSSSICNRTILIKIICLIFCRTFSRITIRGHNGCHNSSITGTDVSFVGCDSCLIQRRSKGRDSNSDEDCDDCNNNQHFHERKALLILHLTHFVHHRNHSPIH